MMELEAIWEVIKNPHQSYASLPSSLEYHIILVYIYIYGFFCRWYRGSLMQESIKSNSTRMQIKDSKERKTEGRKETWVPQKMRHPAGRQSGSHLTLSRPTFRSTLHSPLATPPSAGFLLTQLRKAAVMTVQKGNKVLKIVEITAGYSNFHIAEGHTYISSKGVWRRV